MQARFTGDPNHGGEGANTLSLFGVDFVKGEWSDVSPAVAAKLSGNSHFEVAVNPLDHDADGRAGGSLPDAEIQAMRELLTERGIKFHHKAGRDKLQALLDEAGA